MSEYKICEPNDLRRFATEVLAAVGTDQAGAVEMATQIVASDLAGHESHGVRRLREYANRVKDGWVDPDSQPIIDLDNASCVRVDGKRGYGHNVMQFATSLLIERAKQYGIAAVAVHNCDPAGRFADFCDRAADAGIATYMWMNVSGEAKFVAPPGALEARISTNPIAAGVPRSGGPNLVMDMAISAVAAGRLSDAKERSTPMESDWTNQAGNLLPIGGNKGFVLAVMGEALAGSLTSAGTVGTDGAEYRQGVLAIGIDIERFRPLMDFEVDVAKFAKYLSETPTEPGASPIYMPGERTAMNTQKRSEAGIPIHRVIWEQLEELATEFKLDLPKLKA